VPGWLAYKLHIAEVHSYTIGLSQLSVPSYISDSGASGIMALRFQFVSYDPLLAATDDLRFEYTINTETNGTVTEVKSGTAKMYQSVIYPNSTFVYTGTLPKIGLNNLTKATKITVTSTPYLQ